MDERVDCSIDYFRNASESRLIKKERMAKSYPRDLPLWRMFGDKKTNLLKEFRMCGKNSSNVELVCTDYGTIFIKLNLFSL